MFNIKKHQKFSLFPYLSFSDGFVLLPPCLKNRWGNRAAALVAAPAKQENWKHFAVWPQDLFVSKVFWPKYFSQENYLKKSFLFLAVPRQLCRWPCHWLTHCLTDWLTNSSALLKRKNIPYSTLRDLWPLRHVIRVTLDLWHISSEWCGDMTWPTKRPRQWKRQRQWQWHLKNSVKERP